MKLHDLGYDDWFAARAAQMEMDGCEPVRVTAVDRGAWQVRDARGELPAELSGRLSFQAETPADLPCVGDWALARRYNDDAAALLCALLPRRTFLRRRAPGGGAARWQMIAANVDTALIVQSCRHDFNPARLERCLVAAADGGVEPVVLLSKADLACAAELEDMLALVRGVAPVRTLALSAASGQGMDALAEILLPGRTCCLLGSSGVGKTTLVNRLLGREAFDTRPVSGTGEGVHTTTRRQLLLLDGGALLIDTPGMRELGVAGAVDGVEEGLGEVAALAAACRFADCRHEGEPGCAVRAAVEDGRLPPERLAGYRKLRREAEFADLSALGRRRRDKAFGKLVRSVKKGRKE